MPYQEILDYLHTLANPEIAEHSQRFFKTAEGEYGFGDKFLGIRVPIIRQAVKIYKNIALSDAEKLLTSEYHEVRLFSLLLLVLRFSKSSVHEQKAIYRLYLNNTQYVNNWDLVDSSAHYIVGAFLINRDKSILYDFVCSNVLWERRISIMSTFYFIRNNQFGDTLRISEYLLLDQEDLIHKAVGWMLREVGKRDLSQEVAFLKMHYKIMPRTMLRYPMCQNSSAKRSGINI